MISIDGADANSELPDMSTPNRPKVDQKGLKSEFLSVRTAFGNSERAFLLEVRGTLTITEGAASKPRSRA